MENKKPKSSRTQKRQLVLSRATSPCSSIPPIVAPHKNQQKMNTLIPFMSYETQTRTGLLNLSRVPLSLPPSQCPPPPPTTLRRRSRTPSPFFLSSPTTSTRRRLPCYHPLTQNTRLQPLTPIHATTSVVSQQSPELSKNTLDTDNKVPEQSLLDKKAAEEEQLELGWRSMLEMFPRPRTYSQTASYLDRQNMGMMGSAA